MSENDIQHFPEGEGRIETFFPYASNDIKDVKKIASIYDCLIMFFNEIDIDFWYQFMTYFLSNLLDLL